MKKNIEFEMVTTRGGDTGETSLYSGERIIKSDIIFETTGDLDELNSKLGECRSVVKNVKQIHTIQENILKIGSQVATSPDSELYETFKKVSEKDVVQLENWQNKMMKDAEIPARFILPGEVKFETAVVDSARTIARRAERHLISVIRSEHNPRPDLHECQHYLNRLSDFLFVLARYLDTK